MAEHTPGPWRAGYSADSDRDKEMIVRAEEVDGQPWVAICRCNFGGINIEANATLIAAAPDLLAACEKYHEAIDRLFAELIQKDPGFFPTKSGQPWEAAVFGHSIIAKAKGANP